MGSRASPYDKGPDDLNPPRNPAAFQAPNSEKPKSNTFPLQKDCRKYNPAKYIIPRDPQPNASTRSDKGKGTNAKDGKGKGKKKTSGEDQHENKKDKKKRKEKRGLASWFWDR